MVMLPLLVSTGSNSTKRKSGKPDMERFGIVELDMLSRPTQNEQYISEAWSIFCHNLYTGRDKKQATLHGY